MRLVLSFLILLLATWLGRGKIASDTTGSLVSDRLQLTWSQKDSSWVFDKFMVKKENGWITLNPVSSQYTVLFSGIRPDTTPVSFLDNPGQQLNFPPAGYKYLIKRVGDALSPVQLNIAGSALHFNADRLVKYGKDSLVFSKELPLFNFKAVWKTEKKFSSDLSVTLVLEAKKEGFYSMATPALTDIPESEMAWAAIPGYFQGKVIEKDFIKAYFYGHGIPDRPVLVRERTASTLSPLVTTKSGITLAVVPQPGTSMEPWCNNMKNNAEWKVGLSLLTRNKELMPTLYHPVLGQKGSCLKAGETATFKFLYSISDAQWYPVYKHAVNDIYRFNDFLKLKKSNESLTERILGLQEYVSDDSISMWRIEDYQNSKIGAQSYLGGVHKADNDAMKNSDYGAMWMLAGISSDAALTKDRLPYALNFKVQQQVKSGFFKGAPKGQYYLWKGRHFIEEWGDYVEPIGLTYYNTLDIGNVLLFEPNNEALKRELRSGADRLIEWMKLSGEWAVAYDHTSKKEIFTDLKDLRPTFYGLVVAYRILNDKKYLEAACKGADWFIENAVNNGHFLGVCGDTRFAPDFATGQSAQALMDLYDLTKHERYLRAAIKVARFYTTSIYTHPIPSTKEITVKGKRMQEWEISQVGLSFEHGGTMGSANVAGPILLASHAGMFVRIFKLTKDSLFLNMARAAVLGRDAFVNKDTHVASYYWNNLDAGSKGFPHHAWWQIGWITDYLLEEVSLRSDGNISFPRGFITPKVGPHQTYGFMPGNIYGNSAALFLKKGVAIPTSASIDYFMALDREGQKLFLMLLNDSFAPVNDLVKLDLQKVPGSGKSDFYTAYEIGDSNRRQRIDSKGTEFRIDIPAYGLKVVEINLKENTL